MNLLRPKLYTQFIVVCILGDFTNAATCNLPIPFRNVVRMATIMAVLFTIRGVTTLLFAMRNGGVDAPLRATSPARRRRFTPDRQVTGGYVLTTNDPVVRNCAGIPREEIIFYLTPAAQPSTPIPQVSVHGPTLSNEPSQSRHSPPRWPSFSR